MYRWIFCIWSKFHDSSHDKGNEIVYHYIFTSPRYKWLSLMIKQLEILCRILLKWHKMQCKQEITTTYNFGYFYYYLFNVCRRSVFLFSQKALWSQGPYLFYSLYTQHLVVLGTLHALSDYLSNARPESKVLWEYVPQI